MPAPVTDRSTFGLGWPRLPRRHGWVLLAVFLVGLALFVWRVGSTGLVDETPPLFAASARAMARSGDWLTPRVNGLPRYDKPPLVYWLMGLGYALPGQGLWNPLGTWASNLPSALSSVAMMLLLTATLLRWPQPAIAAAPVPPALRAITAASAALAFALSPLVLLWSRMAVSDALFSALLGAALLLFWWRYAGGRAWWAGWLLLGLAVLAKGPVAVVLAALTLLLFAALQRDGRGLLQRLRPRTGLLITAAVALPWYGLELLVEGRPFVDSFFGYHNLQRFSGVVNNHLQPWWFFLPVLVVASLPFSPLLLAGLWRHLRWSSPGQADPATSLGRFAGCWLLAVLLFFTVAATKLPSYWIPATPAAGLLIALAAQDLLVLSPLRGGRWWRLATLALVGLLSLGLLLSARWIPLIVEPELPTLPAELLASGAVVRAGLCFGLALLAGVLLWWAPRPWGQLWLLAQQLAVGLFVTTALVPLIGLGDRLRQQPVRRIASTVVQQRAPAEPLAMVGILKPSLHYYSGQVVIYEGVQPSGPANLADRLLREHRRGQHPTPVTPGATLLLVIDQRTARLPHWSGLVHQPLDADGLYRLWRVQRSDLQRWVEALRRRGQPGPDWQRPRPERY
ncbi:MAG: glycosyltransferase family 39 protein [Cyanobacteria bacterium M_surface_9_m1_291]|nr:glycosyltransferase family 39 protein [Cyanobacteria bacterium M_surface_9_m1_291]